MCADELTKKLKETYGAPAEIARVLKISRTAVRNWPAVPKQHRKRVAALLTNFVPRKKAPATMANSANVAWPGAMIDKEFARLKAHPCAPWADIIRLDKAIAVARHGQVSA